MCVSHCSTDLADTINNLFSDFDKCVTHRNLTKMDTIGDACTLCVSVCVRACAFFGL